MKSIKQQYIDLHEGKMSQQNFMRNLRMTLPQYVTNVTSFGDAVKILKNKGILSEIFIKENKDPMQQGYDAFQMEDSKNPYPPQSEEAQLWLQGWGKAQEEEQDSNSYDYDYPEDAGDDEYPRDYDNIDDFNDGEFWESLNKKNLDIDQEELKKGIKVEKEHTNDPVKAEEIALEHLKEDPKYYTKLAKAGLEEDYDMEDYNSDEDEAREEEKADNMVNQRLEDEAEEMKKIDAMIKKHEEEESGKYTTGGEQFSIKEAKSKWENTSGKSMYAQFKEIDNLNGQEVLIGIDWEMEKDEELSKIEAAKIVIKNLKKNPIYYTAMLLAGGKEMTEIPTIGKLKPGSDKMRELKGEDSLVDKDNGMKPVKDVEKVKASANKATKETNKPEKGISLMSLVAKASRGVDKMAATGEKMKVVKEGMDDERDFDPDVEGKPSSAFQRFVSQKRGEEATAAQAAEIHNGLKRGDKVKVNSEAAKELRINPNEIFIISSFNKFRPGSLLQSIDVVLKNSAGKEVGSVNIEHVYEAGSNTPKVDTGNVASTIFSRNAGISQKLKSLTKDDLMEMIRKELEEALGAYGGDNVTDVAGHQLDEVLDLQKAGQAIDKLLKGYKFHTFFVNSLTDNDNIKQIMDEYSKNQGKLPNNLQGAALIQIVGEHANVRLISNNKALIKQIMDKINVEWTNFSTTANPQTGHTKQSGFNKKTTNIGSTGTAYVNKSQIKQGVGGFETSIGWIDKSGKFNPLFFVDITLA